MRYYHFLIVLLLSLQGVRSVSAHDVNTHIKLTAVAEGIRADYQLDQPVTEFHFDASEATGEFSEAMPLRNETWVVDGAEFVFDGQTLSKTDGEVFSSFTILAKPDARDYDRVYSAVARMGPKSYAFYTRYFYPSGGSAALELCTAIGDDCSSDAVKLYSPDIIRGGTYLALGLIKTKQYGGVTFRASDETPESMMQTIAGFLETSTQKIQMLLGDEAPATSSIFLTYKSERMNGTSFRGSVTPGPSMILKVFGPSQDGKWLQEFIGHEVIHFWNVGLYESSDEAQPWLHEGSASYFAADLLGEADAKASGWLNGCMGAVSDEPLNGSEGTVGGSVPYDCGAVIHWLINAAISGDGDVGTIWHDMFAEAKASASNLYSVQMFKEQVLRYEGGVHVWPVVAAIINETGQDRWSLLFDKADDVNVSIRELMLDEYERNDLLVPVMFAVLDSHCTHGSRGFWTEEGYLKLDTGDRCGPLSGNPIVRTINGLSVLENPAQVYRTVVEVCKDGGTITFSNGEVGESEHSISLPCENEPIDLMVKYHVSRR